MQYKRPEIMIIEKKCHIKISSYCLTDNEDGKNRNPGAGAELQTIYNSNKNDKLMQANKLFIFGYDNACTDVCDGQSRRPSIRKS